MTFRIGEFRSSVPEMAGWHSHIPEPEPAAECPECGGPGGDDDELCAECRESHRFPKEG